MSAFISKPHPKPDGKRIGGTQQKNRNKTYEVNVSGDLVVITSDRQVGIFPGTVTLTARRLGSWKVRYLFQNRDIQVSCFLGTHVSCNSGLELER